MFSLFRRNSQSAKLARRTPICYRPRLEALEDRTLLSAGWAIATGGSGGLSNYTAPALSQPDAAGNLYVTGYFNGTVTFGSTTLTASSNNTSFVAKVDPNGNVLWAEQFGGLAGGNWTGIAVDGSGNVYLSGNFDGTQSFGGTTLTSPSGSATGYICKADSNGNFLWAKEYAYQNSGYGDRMAVDGSGNTYLAWHATPSSGTTGFLSKYDPNGNSLWTEQLPSGGTPISVALDASNNAYVGGGGNFLAEYDTNGNQKWEQATPRPINSVAIYQDTTGKNWLYTAVWPTTALPTDVQKIDAASGTVLWSQQIGSPSVRPYNVAVDTGGNVYLTGAFTATIDFDPGPGVAILTAQASDVFVVKLDPSGNFLSVHSFGGTTTNNDGCWSLALDSGGNIYTAGSFGNTSNFDTGSQIVSLASSGSGNSLFVVKTTQDKGAIFGQVFNDLNDNGVFDPSSSNPESGIPNVILYLDLNNSGSYVPGDPTATTDANGNYEFNHLAAGSYVVRQVTPSGWTQTDPSAGGANAVTLGTGQFVDSETFGDYTPSQTKNYASINVPLKLGTKSGAAVTSMLTVNDAATIFDLNVSVNVATTSTSLAFSLTAPDGTSVSVQPGTTHVQGLNYHGTKGAWTLKMWNVAPAPKPSTLNAWSLQILESTTTLSSPLTANPSSATAGSSGTSNGPGTTAPSSTSSPGNGGPLSGVDQVLANFGLLLSDVRNAFQSELFSLAAMWQSAEARAVQQLDALLSMEAGAMGVSTDTLIRALLLASLSSTNEV